MIKNRAAKNFIIQELVPKTVYDARGQRAWQLIDQRLIANLNELRRALGIPLTVNNWHSGGARDQSGLRIVGQEYYKPYSQHSFGRAVDIICAIDADEIRRRIEDEVILLTHPACFEEGVSWLHMDVRNTDHTQHYFFKP